MRPYIYAAFVLLTSASTLSAAYAAGSHVPAAVEPSRVQQQIAPPKHTLAPPVPQAAPAIMPEQAPPDAEKIKFVLKHISVEGMTVYSDADIVPLYQDHAGKEVSLADVYALANELTAKYRNDGYILTQVVVPPQEIDGGAIRLQAVEGFIDHVTIQSERKSDVARLAGYGDDIRASKPLNAKVLEKYMLLLNDIPGLAAKSVLSPSATPGAADLTIVVEHKATDASVQADNRGSRYMGQWQYNASARLNDALGYGEGLGMQLSTAPDEMKYGSANVSWPLGTLGTVANVSGSVTSTTPGYTLEELGIKGTAHAYSVGLTHPFLRARSENVSGTMRFDYLDTVRTDSIGGPRIEDRLRVVRFSGYYQFPDRYEGANTLSAEVSKGLDIFNTKRRFSPDMTRANGDPLFFKATAEITRLQRLTDRLDVFVAAAGQWSPSALLASEEFGVGGSAYGSAYDSSEITGRQGIAARLEFRGNGLFGFSQVQPYSFFDAGKVWDPDNASARDRINALSSAGFGLRATVNDILSGSVELAAPLTRKVGTADNKHPRLFGVLSAKF